MKLIKLFILLLSGAFITMGAAAQSNAILNMLVLNSGDVTINRAGSLQATIGNTGPSVAIANGKIQLTYAMTNFKP